MFDMILGWESYANIVCDVLVDSDYLRYDIYPKFQSLCRL